RRESALFRIQHFQSDGRELLDTAVWEVGLRPLAAYAVSSFLPTILNEWQGVTEIELVISYQKTAAQIAAVRTVNSPDTASALLGQMLRTGETYMAMLCPVNIANVGFLEGILRTYYYDHPLEVIVFPDTVINLYPSSGSGNQRIAEITLDFGFDQDTLTQMREDLWQAAADLIVELPEDLSPAQQVIRLAEILGAWYEPRSEEDEPDALHGTAYGALTREAASDMGIARAFQGLLRLLGLHAQIIQGELDGVPHVWNIVRLDGYYYHVDVSRLVDLGPELTLFVPDEVMMFQNGYSWDTVLYPRADSELRYGDF
ncbi:MAG: hypothetical protein FWD84_04165, partial [Oscillospiraceae bacterium]|nr:hypothetical protein [Oscillospiraceae bacterium]